MACEPILLGDIGGTNARFAVARGDGIEHSGSLRVAAHASAAEAIGAYLDALPKRDRPGRAALACAGPVEDGVVTMTNCPWRLDAREIARRFGLRRVDLVNDFAAQAWAAPKLDPAQLRGLGGGKARPDAPSAVLGPGTGLGIATYLPAPLGPAVIVGEGGHVTMAATDEREAAVLAKLRGRFGHVSAERVLSGDGLVNLYQALGAIEAAEVPPRDAAGIAAAGTSGACPASAAGLEMFCAMLGTLAGNLAITLGAHGGVYIAGGIAPRIADVLAASRFRESFEAKGRFRGYLAAIPTWIVMDPAPAFVGLIHFLAEQDRDAPR